MLVAGRFVRQARTDSAKTALIEGVAAMTDTTTAPAPSLVSSAGAGSRDVVFDLIEREGERQRTGLQLIASENPTHRNAGAVACG